MNYKVKFSDREINMFNTIERDNIRLSAMSVFGVMVSSMGDDDICSLTYKQIIFRTKRKYKMVLSMLKRRIDKLLELGFIEIIKEQVTKTKQRYSYKIIRKSESFIDIRNGKENGKRNGKENETHTLESVETTNFVECTSIQNTKSKKNLYNTYIKDLSIAKEITVNLFKELKIKKDIIKNSVLKRVSEVYKTINEKGADKYITAIILNAVTYFDILSKKHNMQLASNKRNSKNKRSKRVSNFEGRTISKAEYDDLYDDPSLVFS